MFITFEGGEGSGKTTQITLLKEYLESIGKKVYVTRQPGGTETGKEIRKVIMECETNPLTELLLFYADRNEHYHEIAEKLNEGFVVICDRYQDSSFVYQQYVQQATTPQNFKSLEKIVPVHQPHITFIIDIDPEVGLKRKYEQNEMQKYELKGLEFHNKIREGYEVVLKSNPLRCIKIDGNESVENINNNIVETYKIIYNKTNIL